MKRILLSMAAVVTAIALLVSGCTKTPVSTEPSQGTNKETAAADKSTNGPVEVTYATFRVGAHVQAPGEKIMLEEFNRLYGDKIKLVIEELPSDDVYVNKMKALAASNSLPDVFDGKNGVRELAIANGTARNLLPYLEEDPEWKKYVGDMAIKANTNEDGNLYSISYSQRIIGYYYNKSMFEKAGIKPAETWEEFMSNCEALKKAGFTPFANATGENAWTVNLLLGAMIGTANEAGNKLMNEKPVTNFNTPEVINALENIKKILTDYSNTDALGAVYANAANVFCQEQAAMIANGPWMVGDFTNPEKSVEGLDQRLGVALYPNKGIYSEYDPGFVLCAKDDNLEEALTFLKFRTGPFSQKTFLETAGSLPLTNNIELSEEFKAKKPLVVQHLELASQAEYKFKTLDVIADSSVIDSFAKLYPELVFGEIDAQTFAQKLTDAVYRQK